MKKIMFIIAATLLSIAAQAQTDTLRWGQRDPTYYYYWPGFGPWIDLWTDSYVSFYQPEELTIGYSVRNSSARRKEIVIFPYYTDRPLKVIGIAAPMQYCLVPDLPYADTSIANCPQESFVLYEWNGTRPAFVDSSCWTCTRPRRWFKGSPTAVPVRMYEAYFDKPHTVLDTFYVGMTTNCGYLTWNSPQDGSPSTAYFAHPQLKNFAYFAYFVTNPALLTKPIMMGNIPQMVYPDSVSSLSPFLSDTSLIMSHSYSTSYDGFVTGFPCIWPIIDTTGVNFDDLYEGWDTIPGLDSALHRFDCPRVSRLRPEGLGHGCVNMAWRGDSCHAAYQLKYGKFFDPEEDYRQYDVTGNNIYIDVDSNVLYKVMVRGRCGCGLEEWSPWVSTMFLLTAYNATVVDSNQLRLDEGLEMLTTVSPNPAHGKATVFSSLHIRSIDVYSADGHRLDHINVGGLSHELDLSRYAKGLCLLKINTYRGTTVRKLIVE